MTHCLLFVSCRHWKYDTAVMSEIKYFISSSLIGELNVLFPFPHFHLLSVFTFTEMFLFLFSTYCTPPVGASLEELWLSCRGWLHHSSDRGGNPADSRSVCIWKNPPSKIVGTPHVLMAWLASPPPENLPNLQIGSSATARNPRNLPTSPPLTMW